MIFDKVELNVWGSIFLNNLTYHWEHYCHSITYGSIIWYIMFPCHRHICLCDFFACAYQLLCCMQRSWSLHFYCIMQELASLNFGQILFMLCSSVFVKQGSFPLVTFKVPTQLESTDFNMLTVGNYQICLYIACDHRRTASLVSIATVLCQNSKTGWSRWWIVLYVWWKTRHILCYISHRDHNIFAKLGSFWWNVLLDRQRIFPVGKNWL
jgi:hypothetical protein